MFTYCTRSIGHSTCRLAQGNFNIILLCLYDATTTIMYVAWPVWTLNMEYRNTFTYLVLNTITVHVIVRNINERSIRTLAGCLQKPFPLSLHMDCKLRLSWGKISQRNLVTYAHTWAFFGTFCYRRRNWTYEAWWRVQCRVKLEHQDHTRKCSLYENAE